jgi:hypothetical protein
MTRRWADYRWAYATVYYWTVRHVPPVRWLFAIMIMPGTRLWDELAAVRAAGIGHVGKDLDSGA